MATTTYAGLRYPTSANAPNGPQQIQDLATDLDQAVIVRVPDAAARAGLSNKYDGMPVYTVSEQRYYWWDATAAAWVYAAGKPPPIAVLSIAGGWAAGTSGAPGVYKDASGIVRFVGGMTNSSTYNPNVAATMGTVPPGYRPATTTFVLVAVSAPSASILIQINTNGTVVTFNSGTTSITSGASHWLSSAAGWHTTYAGTVPLA